MKIFYVGFLFFSWIGVSAQNIGIGTNTPLSKLHIFSGASGFASAPFSPLVVEGSNNTYFNFLTPNSNESGVLFGKASDAASGGIIYNNSASLNGLQFRTNGNNTRMIVDNIGRVGIGITPTISDGIFEINGRMRIRSGGSLGTSAGLWLNNTNNSAQAAFFGMEDDTHVGFYGSSSGWSLTMNTITGRVGIGITNPNAPLSFPPSLGKKITLYPGTTGDVGFGVAGNRLQIYSDNPNADVAIGYDAAGVFNERFAVKPNGALAVNGSTGLAGQRLSSNGTGAAASWVNPEPTLYDNSQQFFQSSTLVGVVNYVTVPGLTQTFTCPAGKGMFILKGQMRNNGCFGCGEASCKYDILVDGVLIDRNIISVGNGAEAIVTNGATLYNVSSGTHTVTVNVDGNGGNFNAYGFRVIVIVLPQ